MKKVFALLLSLAMLAGLFAGCGGQATVKALHIIQQPEKLNYEEGELFDPAGIRIDAEMSDGSTQPNVAYTHNRTEPLTKQDNSVTFLYGRKSTVLQIRVEPAGNNDRYAVAQTPALESSPLAGKTILWLGSSVTFGSAAMEESMADFIAKKHGAVSIKQAVSGTTLADVEMYNRRAGYTVRLDEYIASEGSVETLDAFVCQLSTNDASGDISFGEITADSVTDPDSFDKTTTFGAIEYIIATVRAQWGCPIFFYTGSYYENERYAQMVDALKQITEKWDITVIDLYGDPMFNDISPEEYSLYMDDSVHPTRAGYRDWWLPKFEEALLAAVTE